MPEIKSIIIRDPQGVKMFHVMKIGGEYFVDRRIDLIGYEVKIVLDDKKRILFPGRKRHA